MRNRYENLISMSLGELKKEKEQILKKKHEQFKEKILLVNQILQLENMLKDEEGSNAK